MDLIVRTAAEVRGEDQLGAVADSSRTYPSESLPFFVLWMARLTGKSVDHVSPTAYRLPLPSRDSPFPKVVLLPPYVVTKVRVVGRGSSPVRRQPDRPCRHGRKRRLQPLERHADARVIEQVDVVPPRRLDCSIPEQLLDDGVVHAEEGKRRRGRPPDVLKADGGDAGRLHQRVRPNITNIRRASTPIRPSRARPREAPQTHHPRLTPRRATWGLGIQLINPPTVGPGWHCGRHSFCVMETVAS
jgi:hypothetical protein